MKRTKIRVKHISFIDLFAGIGGIRLGFERAAQKCKVNTKCVFTSEINNYATDVYRKRFPSKNHNPLNDITKINEVDLPNSQVLLAGFPCQAFSIAGQKGGFEDTRGTLFFDIARIINEKRPNAFLLENVKGLISHRGGKTLGTILNVLKKDLGYKSTQYCILNSKDFGVPQNRERIFIVGFKSCGGGFSFPKGNYDKDNVLGRIIEEETVSAKYYLSNVYVKSMRKHKERHAAKGNGFGFEIKNYDDVANAIVIGGMGKERNLIVDKRLKDFTPVTAIKGKINREGIRRMTPLEWERLQGLPDNFTDCVSDTQRYKQLGNCVTVNVVEAISKNIIEELLNPRPYKPSYSNG